jgi:transcription termination factor Rho
MDPSVLARKQLTELKSIAAHLDMRGYQRLKKAELIDAIVRTASERGGLPDTSSADTSRDDGAGTRSRNGDGAAPAGEGDGDAATEDRGDADQDGMRRTRARVRTRTRERTEMRFNGEAFAVGPGDVCVTRSGDRHALVNTGPTPMRLLVIGANL